MPGTRKQAKAQQRETPRPKYTGAPTAPANDTPGGLAVVPMDQLRHVIRTELEAALEESASARPDGPHLLDMHDLAAALRISLSTVNKLRRLGMPERKIGDSPRFEYQACIAWLDANQGAMGA